MKKANINRWAGKRGKQELVLVASENNPISQLFSELGHENYQTWELGLPFSVRYNLDELKAAAQSELGKLKLANIRQESFSAYCTIKNIATYSQLPYTAVNRQQTIDQLVSTAGYETLADVQNEFPHLWKE